MCVRPYCATADEPFNTEPRIASSVIMQRLIPQPPHSALMWCTLFKIMNAALVINSPVLHPSTMLILQG